MMKNTQASYGSVSKLLHWLIGLTVIGLLTLGISLEYIKDQTLAGQMYMIHKSTGMVVLGLMVIRLWWRLTNKKPASSTHIQAWQKSAEQLVHYLFYVALFAMPLSGWVMATASGYLPSLYGWGAFAMPFVPKSKAIAGTASWIHTVAGYTLIALVVLHIAATVQHYVIHKENILKRML